jgi:hypothetical protein
MPATSMMMNCPMSLEGTSVAVADTRSGVTVSITTKPENVVELRRRVEQMAAMHHSDHPSQAMIQGQMMPGTVKYESIENGARLTLTPKDASKLNGIPDAGSGTCGEDAEGRMLDDARHDARNDAGHDGRIPVVSPEPQG